MYILTWTEIASLIILFILLLVYERPFKKNLKKTILNSYYNNKIYDYIIKFINKEFPNKIISYNFDNNSYYNVNFDNIQFKFIDNHYIYISIENNNISIESDNCDTINKFCMNCISTYSNNKLYQIVNDNWKEFSIINKLVTFENTFVDKNIIEDIEDKILLLQKQKNNSDLTILNNKIFFTFHGEKGNGKKLMVHAISNKYKKDIYKIDLTNDLDENILNLIKIIPTGNIILIENKINYQKEKNNMINSKIMNSKLNESWFDDEKKKVLELYHPNKITKYSDFIKKIIKICNNDTIIILKTNYVDNFDSSLFEYKNICISYEFKVPDKEQINYIYHYLTKNNDNLNEIVHGKNLKTIVYNIYKNYHKI